jgi:redox-sensing transcriptional repressor
MADEGVETVSSSDLGTRLGVSAAQIRRDLSYFGEFGKQGKGYNVNFLLTEVYKILGLGRDWPIALVGLGHLGRALLHYDELRDRGFCISALFDHNPNKVGEKVGGLPIHAMGDLHSIISEQNIRIAIIAVPAEGAQSVADTLVDAGILAILNYSPITVQAPANVRLRHIDPVIALQSMTYYLDSND